MGMQDMTLRPSLKDIDEELLHLVAEQSAANDMLAEKRQKDQALLEQMLPPQVVTTKPCRVAFFDNDNKKRFPAHDELGMCRTSLVCPELLLLWHMSSWLCCYVV